MKTCKKGVPIESQKIAVMGYNRFIFVTALALASVGSASAQLGLTGTSYTQNFNSLSNGLPAGWSVRTNATASSLGTGAGFPTPSKSWGDSTGEFGNCASLTNNSGALSTGSESAATQSGYTNRLLGARQTGSFGDPGAAFVLQIGNTIGVSNLAFSVDLNLLRSNANSTTWTIDYAVGNSPSAFTTLGSYSDPRAVGVTRQTYNLGTDANHQSQNVWIRIVALTATSAGGTRDTFGLDNFVLNYSGTPLGIPQLTIQKAGANAVLTWASPAFHLESSPSPTGSYTNIPGATSPYVVPVASKPGFFRLKYP